MLGLLYLLLIAIWLALALLIGRWAYRKSGSRLRQLVATIIALWIPLWDVVPGYLMYRNAIGEIGGVRIQRTVRADGYLDRVLRNDCWKRLKSSPYAYCEEEVGNSRRSSLGVLNAKAGYYEYRLSPIDSPECAPFREQLNAPAMQEAYRLGPNCVVVTRRDSPISQYEYLQEDSSMLTIWPVPQIYASWFQVQDRLSGETIAQATQLKYDIWISRVLRLPIGWNYRTTDNGDPIRLLPRDVIQPNQ